jgi:carbon storage regulator CsrA
MLVVQRNVEESIKIGDNIWVSVVRERPGNLRLAVTAPWNVRIERVDRMPTKAERKGCEKDAG